MREETKQVIAKRQLLLDPHASSANFVLQVALLKERREQQASSLEGQREAEAAYQAQAAYPDDAPSSRPETPEYGQV